MTSISIPPIEPQGSLRVSSAAPRTQAAGVSGAPGNADVYQQFESFVLQSFIEAMLPSDAKQVFGAGLAGQVFKSMLAEKLAVEIARRGDLGIAASIGADQPATTRPADREAR